MRNLVWLGVGAVVCSASCLLGVSLAGCSSSNASPASDDGGGPGGGSLYARLGGHAGIRGAVDQVVAAELADPDIASYFFNQVASPVPAGHPTVDQLEECLTDQLANAAGGTEAYPETVTDDAGSFTCRDMATIHAPLKISGGTFTKFVTIAAGELTTLGVSSSDVATIGMVLNGAKPAVVDPSLADAGEQAFPGAATSDGGESADAGTLYGRLGGHAGIRSAVDQVVGAELADPDIASYFFNQVASPVPAGHPTVDQLEECLTDQLGSAAGGTETYPTTVTDDAGSFTCRSMTAIHQGLKISGGTFTKFVTIAGGELTTLGVSSADVATVATVLTGTQSAIVDPNLADAGEMAYDAANP